MRVVFDTGSTNLWITGSKCSKELHEKYRQDASATYVKSKDYLVHIKFGTGQLSGKTARDRVKVGPFQIPKPGCHAGSKEPGCIAQMFGVIDDEVGNIFAELDDFGGILGLGHRDMSMMSPESASVAEDGDGHVTPFFEHLVETEQLSTPEFSMYMNAQKNKYSAILFGGVDSRVVKKRPGQQMFDLARIKGRGGDTGREPHYWSVQLYRIVYNKDLPNYPMKDLDHHKGKCGEGRQDGKCEKVLQASFTPSRWNPRKAEDGYGCDDGSNPWCHKTGTKGRLDYHQDPALVFDSGTTLYTGPQAGVDEILEWIKPVQCGKLNHPTEGVGTITYEVQGLKDPESHECTEHCPCVGPDCT